MYTPGPTDHELESLGLMREDVEDTSVTEVWPENWLPFQVFHRMGNRWLHGMNGPTCLDLSCFHLFTQRCNVKKKDRDAVFDAVLTLESEALRVMAKANAESAKKH